MSQQQNALLNTEQVDRLLTLVEEATRATAETPRRFIEPARGTLERAKSRRHHIVFGRRGSGKKSLLRKAAADLTLRRIPTAFVDLEAFKGHTYPDVLLSVLIETLNAFDKWLATAGSNASTKSSFWTRLWGGVPDRPPLEKTKLQQLRNQLQSEIALLSNLLHSEGKVELVQKVGASLASTARMTSEVSAKERPPLVRRAPMHQSKLRQSSAPNEARTANKQRIELRQQEETRPAFYTERSSISKSYLMRWLTSLAAMHLYFLTTYTTSAGTTKQTYSTIFTAL